MEINHTRVNAVERDFVRLFTSILIILAIPFAFALIWFFNVEANKQTLVPLVFLLWLCAFYLMSKRFELKLVLRCGLIAILEFAVLVFIAGQFQDNSWDGNQYQSEGPLQIFLGWNPFREIILPAKWDTSWAVWLDSLPKFGWEISAFILHLGGTQAASKILSLIGLLIIAKSVALLCSSYNLSYFKRILLILASLSFPIGVSQFPTSYQYGFSASWTISVILVIFANQKIKEFGYDAWPIIAALSIGAFLSKYSQAIPVSVALIGYFLFSKELKNVLRKMLYIVFPVVFLGFNPYITNLLSFGNPLYPMKSVNYLKYFNLGKENIIENSVNATIQQNIYYPQTAKNILGDFQPIQFIESLFSRTAHVSDKIPSELKFPGIFSKSEFEYFTNPDARMGGFGPLFSLTVLILIFGAMNMKLKNQHLTKYLIFGTVMAAILTPYPWWARYVGFIYSIVLLFIFLLLISKSTMNRNLGCAAAGILICQSLILLYGHAVKEISHERPIYTIAAPIQEKVPLELRDQSFSGYRLDWGRGKPYLYENIEVDFFLNHIEPNLSSSDIQIVKSCYSVNGTLASWGHPLKLHVDDEFFNHLGLLKIKEDCDFNLLQGVEKKWSTIPFHKERILR